MSDSLNSAILRAVADPGQFVDRRFSPCTFGLADPEPLSRWIARAVTMAIDPFVSFPEPLAAEETSTSENRWGTK